MAHTVGTWVESSCDRETCLLQARAQMSRVLPTAVSPTTTHLTSSWWGCSLSIPLQQCWDSAHHIHYPWKIDIQLARYQNIGLVDDILLEKPIAQNVFKIMLWQIADQYFKCNISLGWWFSSSYAISNKQQYPGDSESHSNRYTNILFFRQNIRCIWEQLQVN